MPQVQNMSEARGRELAEDEVYVGRGSKWGNPYHIGRHGTREEVIEKFRKYFFGSGTAMGDAHELRGKDLFCFCAPLSCHADILLEFANREKK